MNSESAELTRLRAENSRLAYANTQLSTEIHQSRGTIRSLQSEKELLRMQMEESNSAGSKLKIRRLERENRELGEKLEAIEDRALTEKMRRERTEASLSEVEDDNSYLKDREAKQQREKEKLKYKLTRTKSSLRRVSMSQDMLQSEMEEDKHEYKKAEKEFEKLENSLWTKTKRAKRRKSAYDFSSLFDSDSDLDYSYYRPRNYLRYPTRRSYYFYDDFNP